MTQIVVDSRGQPIQLGRLLGKGGEGDVYELSAGSGHVAKLYRQPITRDKADKIRLMARLRNERLERLTAWPLDLLLRPSGEPVGLLMPKVTGRKDIHRLYSPKSRRSEFVRADWRFLIAAAANIARAFRVVHEAGCVIGDVNHGSVMVGEDATVRLIDCDSFQVVADGRRFLCEVGVEDFTPPELQNKPFAGVLRTTNHDNFGLAVMIFRLLFMGRHPFAGRFLGRGEMPLGRAIADCRFAYGSHQAQIQMERPPGTPPLSIVGNVVGSLFEQSFAREMMAGGRPGPNDWVAALAAFSKEVAQCRIQDSHWHLKGLGSCPWCAMEAATGVSLFPVVLRHAPAGPFVDVDGLWRQILAVPHPGPLPPVAPPLVTASAQARAVGRANKMRKAAGPIGAIVALAVGLFVLTLPSLWLLLIAFGFGGYYGAKAFFGSSADVDRLRAARDEAAARSSVAERAWIERAGSGGFDTKLKELERLHIAYSQVPAVRQRKLDQLRSDQRRIQLEKFLDRFEIETATITGVGAGRKQTLESYGIETAADVIERKITNIPGFGRVLTSNLVAWRRSIEAQFKFDPSKGIDPVDVATVEREVTAERTRLAGELAKGLNELKAVQAQIIVTRQQLHAQVDAAMKAKAQAAADFEAANA